MFKHSTLAAVLIIVGSTSAVSAKSDTSFLTDAIQINLAEIAVGDLAQKNGASDDVKAFGKMLVDDHTASNQKATSLAQANGVTAPNEPKPADKEAQQHLATLSGPDFDREFAKAMVKGHKEAIGKFEAASKGDDDIAKFAQDTLPTLLGMGEKNVAISFSSLKVAEKNGNRYLVVETTKEALQAAPGYVYDSGKKVWVPGPKQG
jgi:putative membrane protein